MSIGKYGSVFDPNAVSTSQFFKTGELFEYLDPTYGYQIYRGILYNGTGTSPQGEVLAFASGSSLEAAEAGAGVTKLGVAGIVQRAAGLPDTYYGLVLYYGRGMYLAGGDITIDLPLMTAATGYLDDSTIHDHEDEIVAMSKSTNAAGAGILCTCELHLL